MKKAISRLLGGEKAELSPPPACLFPEVETPIVTWGNSVDLLEFDSPEDLGAIDWNHVDWSMIGDTAKPKVDRILDPAIRIEIIESWNRHLNPAEPTEDLRRLEFTSEDLRHLKFEERDAKHIDDIINWFNSKVLNMIAANRRTEIQNADMQGW